MATTKKTPAVKTTPAPKAAPAAKVKPVKVGSFVNIVRRNGDTVSGKVTAIDDKSNGRWITVNTSSDKKKLVLATARASQVSLA